jgi:hypothetical protein
MRGGQQPAGFAIEPPQRAFFGQGVDVPLDGEGAGETEMRLNLAERRGDAMLPMMRVDELEDVALTIGQWFGWHSVQVNTCARGWQ